MILSAIYLKNFLDMHNIRMRNLLHDVFQHLSFRDSHLHLQLILDLHLLHRVALAVAFV